MMPAGLQCETLRKLLYDLIHGEGEEEAFKQHGLPIIRLGDQPNRTYSFRWLLNIKDAISIGQNNSEAEYILLEKIYKNRELHEPCKSLYYMTSHSDLTTAILQLIKEAGV